MKYDKPHVAVLPPAASAIQGTPYGKSHPTQVENLISHGTPAAYEADE